MRAKVTRLFAIIAVLAVAIVASGQRIERKVVSKVAPEYPALLKQKMIGGIVRVIATVAPSGAVQQAEIAGGNPILGIAAENAVKQWKFVPAERETRESITFNFDPAKHY